MSASPRRASGSQRIPHPGPAPSETSRTPEQRAALWVGAVMLVACVLSVDLAWRVVSGATRGVIVSLLPVTYLAAGWLTFLLGLVKLSGERRRSSESRGPWLVVGVCFFFLCAPLTGSFVTVTDEPRAEFLCGCGARVRAQGARNCWGMWLRQEVQLLGPAPPPATTCPHLASAPWSRPSR